MSVWANILQAAARVLGVPQALRRDVDRPDQYGKWRVPMAGFEEITPELITAALREADSGFPHRQAVLFAQAIGKAGRLAGNLSTRCKSVASRDWTLTAASEDARDQAVAEWLEPRLRELDLATSMRRLTEAVAYGYAAEQIHWRQVGGEAQVARITHWPTRFLRPDVTGSIGLRTSAGDGMGVPLEEAAFIVHEPGEISADPVASGFMRSALWLWFFKNFCLKAWVMYVEKYGQPFRVGRYGPGAQKEDKDTAFQALVRMGAEAVAMLPESIQLELVQDQSGSKSGGAVFDDLARRIDAEISILVLGQTLTTSVGSEGGARALGEVHQTVRQDFLEWDGAQLSRTITQQLVRPWVRFQFGDEVGVPLFELQTQEPADLKTDSEVWRTMIVDCGLPVSAKDTYDHFGIPMPEDDAELLAPGGALPPLPVPARRPTAAQAMWSELMANPRRAQAMTAGLRRHRAEIARELEEYFGGEGESR